MIIRDSRLNALDGLRGAMCLWVLAGHTCRLTAFPIPILRSAHYAVDGFMILSGFLMAYHALRSQNQSWNRPSTWFAFYIRRYFRISLLYYLLLIPAYFFSADFMRWRALTDQALGIVDRPADIQPFSAHSLLFHVTYLFGLFPKYHASTVLPDWSLSLEMQFYLVFPLFMIFVLRFGWPAFSIAASAIWLYATSPLVHLREQFWQPSPLPLSLLWFVIGMLWASAYMEPDRLRARRKILSAAALPVISRDPHDIILVAGFAWILFSEGWVALGPAAQRTREVLSGNLSKILGRASYSVYLLHLLILTPVAYLLATQLHLSAGLRFTSAFAVTVVATYGLAQPLELLENWGIALGKRLSVRVTRPTTVRYERKAAFEAVP